MDETPPSGQSEAARVALREKHAELLKRRERMLALRDNVERDIRRIDGELVHLSVVGKMFGDDLEVPKATSAASSWNTVLSRWITHTRAADNASAAPQAGAIQPAAPPPAPLAPVPKIKQIVLDRLRAAGSKGIKAAEIRQFIQTTYGIETHEKTVGMQLYRYLKAGQASRMGSTWFFVPPWAEKKNPGGQAGVN